MGGERKMVSKRGERGEGRGERGERGEKRGGRGERRQHLCIDRLQIGTVGGGINELGSPAVVDAEVEADDFQ
jgi:hypothetical protein